MGFNVEFFGEGEGFIILTYPELETKEVLTQEAA